MIRGLPLRLLAAAAGLLTVLGLAAGVYRVPGGSIAVTGGSHSPREPRVAGEGFHLRLPFMERTVLFPAAPIKVEEDLVLRAESGGGHIRLPCRFWLAASRADPGVLFEEAPGGDLAGASRRRLARGSLDEIEPFPRPGDAAAWIAAELLPLGFVEGSLVLGEAREEGGTPGDPLVELRRSYRGPRYPVLVLGLDGADWAVLDPLMESGDLPALRKLRGHGAWGVLRSMQPTLSPLLWTTVATGRTPDVHGIVDFLVHDPASGRDVPMSSGFRKVRALWSILTDLDQPSLTVGWWATWPAEPVLGSMATDRIAYTLFESGAEPRLDNVAWPDGLSAVLHELIVSPEELSLAQVREIAGIEEADLDRARSLLTDPASWEDPVVHLLRILASTLTYQRIALHELGRGQPALSLVYFQGIDEICHRFAHYAPPPMRWADPRRLAAFRDAVPNFYRLQDRLVGELIDAVSAETVVLVISDHGFAWGDTRPTDVPPDIEGKPGRWHTMEGIIMASGPTVKPGRLPADPGLLEIAPTLLSLLSLPLSAEMPGKPIGALTARGELPRASPPTIASYEGSGPRSPQGAPGTASTVDADIVARLTALGYIGGETSATPGGGRSSRPAVTVTGHLNAGNAHLVRRDYLSAEREFRAALGLAPAYVPARLGLAQCLIATGRSEEGYAGIAAALREGPGLDPDIYLTVARFYLERGEAKRGVGVFEQLSPVPDLEAARQAALGILYDAAGDAASGERALRAGLRIDPAQPEALQQIYGLLTRRQEWDELESILRRALVERPGYALAANLLALTLERAGRAEEAIALLEQQLEATPRSLATLANLAGVQIRLGRNESALPLLEKAIEIDPRHAESLVNLIVVKGRLGDVGGARRAFERSGGSSGPVAALNAMAYALFLDGRLAEARTLIDASLERRPGQEEARRLLAAIDEAGARPGASRKVPGL